MSAEASRAGGTRFILPHFTWSTVVGSLVTWMFARVAATAGMGAAAASLGLRPGNPLRLDPVATLLVIGVVGVVGWVSARRRNEDLFLLCLGYGRARQTATIVAPAVLLEAAIALAMSAP
ncbi:MAG TPA: hypothetical protein VM890_03140 [Longimicrobium sp.]|nr:hypothetical protein [Longimicrobium sp.]